MRLHHTFGALLLLTLSLPALAADTGLVAVSHPQSLGLADHLLNSFCEPNCTTGWKTDYTESTDESFEMTAAAAKKAAKKDVRRKPAENQGIADSKSAPAAGEQANAQD